MGLTLEWIGWVHDDGKVNEIIIIPTMMIR
jgi:hypothetical protein